MPGQIGWSDFWGILKKDNAEVANKWYAALGDDFAGWVQSRGPRVVFEVIETAPLGVVLLFIHLLPQDLAKKVGMNFPKKWHEKISEAYFSKRKEIE